MIFDSTDCEPLLCSVAYLLPSATVVVERLCFHRCLSVHKGGCAPPGQADPQPDRTPSPARQTCPHPGRHPPSQADIPWPGRHLPPGQADTRPGRHPPGGHPLPRADGHCSERYASYCNAFLLLVFLFVLKVVSVTLLLHKTSFQGFQGK